MCGFLYIASILCPYGASNWHSVIHYFHYIIKGALMQKHNLYLAIITLSLSSLFCSYSTYANQPANNENATTSQNQQMKQVNINIASAEELAKDLNGIGLNKAKRIVEYRDKFGPFISIEQLKEVSGIGQSILDKNIGRMAL